jgi:hypothetical protein
MKYLFMLLLLAGCGEEVEEAKKTISLSSCSSIAQMLEGSFSYTPNQTVPCTVYIEQGEYAFYSDDQEKGISFGLAMAVNRPKLKDFYKCIQSEAGDNYVTTQESVIVDRKCRKKLGMKELY